jgi:hypothetical protein
MDKGFVVVANNTKDVDYVFIAEALAKSVKNVMPDASITLITDDVDNSNYFDKVVALPYGDLDKDGDWRLINDWQVYEASPYEYTIKLEADLFIPKSIDYWWDVLQVRDIVVSTKIRNFKQEISHNRYYRKFIDINNLPDVYNAITYFKKSELAEKFYATVKDVFINWDSYKSELKCPVTEKVTTDWAYAIASLVLGEDKTTLKHFDSMSMIHMKQQINDLVTENWTDTLVYEISNKQLRVNTIPQMYPFHYHVKKFAKFIHEKL